MGYVLGKADFVLIMVGLTSLFCVISGIQFWFTSYLEEVIGVSQGDAQKLAGTCSLIGPVGGIVLTGLIFGKLGGYTGERALPVCTCALVFAFVSCIFSVFADTSGLVSIFICLEMFSGAFCLPILSGIMIS